MNHTDPEVITVNTLGLPGSLKTAEAGRNTCDRTRLESGPPLNAKPTGDVATLEEEIFTFFY